MVPLEFSKDRKKILVEQDNNRFRWNTINDDSTKIVDTEIGAYVAFYISIAMFISEALFSSIPMMRKRI